MKTVVTAARARTAARNDWGEIQTQQKIAPNVWWFTTAGHGGCVLLVDAKTEIEPWMQPFAEMHWTGFGIRVLSAFNFEEDCAWAVLFHQRDDILQADYKRRCAEAEKYGRTFSWATVDGYRAYVRALVEDWYPGILAEGTPCKTCYASGRSRQHYFNPCEVCAGVGAVK